MRVGMHTWQRARPAAAAAPCAALHTFPALSATDAGLTAGWPGRFPTPLAHTGRPQATLRHVQGRAEHEHR